MSIHPHPKTDKPMLRVELSMLIDAAAITGILVEAMRDHPDDVPSTPQECLDLVRRRLSTCIIATDFTAPEPGRQLHQAEAERLGRKWFPEVFNAAVPYVFQSYLRFDADAKSEDSDPLNFRLHCPDCGSEGQVAGGINDDGEAITIPVSGPCGHRWSLVIRTDDGESFLYATREPTKK